MNIQPPCSELDDQGRPKHAELFDSVDIADHLEAKALCSTCPAVTDCLARLGAVLADSRPGYGPQGTWAGQLICESRDSVLRRNMLEEENWTDADIKSAHAAYARGLRDDHTVTGHRIYERQRRRRLHAAMKAVA